MTEKAIEFDHVGKLYRIGTVGTGTLIHDLTRWWQTRILRRGDPLLKIGETNDREKKGNTGIVWALEDITFDVQKGDVVGIIGSNGAGKSTLLKLLSRITSPTTGVIRANGRIASLLEVGTGFHPELTGRENIYLNGTIMGMSRKEIAGRFDDIVDFSGVARYIDTPIKRYSSGMMVRLGFAVAAFLEPEILIVDEVLAVGDAEFQKQCIGKIRDVSAHKGRTVLFVSHNMSAVRSLCKRGLLIDKGRIVHSGSVDDTIIQYHALTYPQKKDTKVIDRMTFVKGGISIDTIKINGTEQSISVIESDQTLLDIEISGFADDEFVTDVMVIIKNKDGMPMATLAEGHYKGMLMKIPAGRFLIKKSIILPSFLSKGIYIIDLCLHHPMTEWQMKAPSCAKIESMGSQMCTGQPLQLQNHGIIGLETV